METDNSYRRIYKVRLAQGKEKKSYEVTFPFDVVDKEARRRGLPIDEFIKKYQAVAQFNGFNGVLYVFEEIKNGK